MDVKWFFVVIAILLTTSILIGMYFISLNQSLQDRSYSNQIQQSSYERFNNSTIIHYNQTAQDFETIKQILNIKLQDHKTLNQVNATVNDILAFLHSNHTHVIVENMTTESTSTNNNTFSPPLLQAPNTDNKTNGIIIENITGNT